MKFSSFATTALVALVATPLATYGFVPSSPSRIGTTSHYVPSLQMSSPSGPDDELLKQSAEQMKTMTPEDIDRMTTEMESMGPAQKAALKAMGMDPELMSAFSRTVV